MTIDYGYHRGFRLQKAGPALLIVLSLIGLAFIVELILPSESVSHTGL